MDYWLIMKFIGISVAYLGPLDSESCQKILNSYSLHMDEDFRPFTFNNHNMQRSDITYSCVQSEIHPIIEK